MKSSVLEITVTSSDHSYGANQEIRYRVSQAPRVGALTPRE